MPFARDPCDASGVAVKVLIVGTHATQRQSIPKRHVLFSCAA